MGIDKNAAKAHFSQLRNTLLSVEVPEWGGTVYFRPAMTVAEQSAVSRTLNDKGVQHAMIDLLITRALNEDGTKMFLKSERQSLLTEYDSDVIDRVVEEMNKADAAAREDIEKN